MIAPQENVWVAAVRANPEHARNYAQRWRNLVEEGRDIFGEARMIDALADRGSRILDAGCGTGRIGGWLAEHGHHVVGVDLDEYLISVAREDYPEAEWAVGNLATLQLRDEAGAPRQFDLIVSAGNVVTFLAEDERLPALRRLADHLAPEGRLVIGFGAGRGYEFDVFEADAAQSGLQLEQRFSTWQLHAASADFLVAVLSRKEQSADAE